MVLLQGFHTVTVQKWEMLDYFFINAIYYDGGGNMKTLQSKSGSNETGNCTSPFERIH